MSLSYSMIVLVSLLSFHAFISSEGRVYGDPEVAEDFVGYPERPSSSSVQKNTKRDASPQDPTLESLGKSSAGNTGKQCFIDEVQVKRYNGHCQTTNGFRACVSPDHDLIDFMNDGCTE